MTADQAMQVVNHLTFAVQRMRSMALEELGADEVTEGLLSKLNPWIHGPKCLLPALARIQDRGSVEPSELYNLCYIAHELEPVLAMSAGIMATSWGTGVEIPRPDTSWFAQGWQEVAA